MTLNEAINNALEWSQLQFSRYRSLIIGGLASLVLLGAGAGAWTYYKKDKEQKLSSKINQFQIQILTVQQNPEADLAAMDSASSAARELYQIYQKNSWTVNGKRALFFAANFDYLSANYNAAREKYLTLTKSPRHFLAPEAFYFAAQTWEEEGQYEKAVALLREFEVKYPTHSFFGEAALALGRNLVALKKVAEAVAVYDKLSQNKDFENYREKAFAQKRLLALRGLITTSDPGKPLTPPANVLTR